MNAYRTHSDESTSGEGMMFYWTATVREKDLGLLQVAITLGGGTITHSQPDAAGGVEVTYVMGDVLPATDLGALAAS